MQVATRNDLMNKVVIHFDMLTATVKNKVVNKISGEGVITKETDGNLYQNTKLRKYLPKPLDFNSSVGS